MKIVPAEETARTIAATRQALAEAQRLVDESLQILATLGAS